MKTGTMRERVQPAVLYPERREQLEEKVCDYCGADATGGSACNRCHKDLCPDHHFDLSQYAVSLDGRRIRHPFGGFCALCLRAIVDEITAAAIQRRP